MRMTPSSCVQARRSGRSDKENGEKKDLESLLRTWQAGQGAGTYIGVVHRLDQPVEGAAVLARQKEAAAALSAQAAGHRHAENLRGCHPGRVAKSGRAADRLPAAGWQDQHLPGGGQKDAERRKLRWITGYCRYRQRKRNSLWWKSICIPAATIRSGTVCPRGTSLVGDNKYGSMSNAVQGSGEWQCQHHLKLSRMRQKI